MNSLTDEQKAELMLILLRVCDVEEGIRIRDVRADPRVQPYIEQDEPGFRDMLDGLVNTGMIFQRGVTSGKFFRTTALGLEFERKLKGGG